MDCCREIIVNTKGAKPQSSSEPVSKEPGQYHVLFAKEVGQKALESQSQKLSKMTGIWLDRVSTPGLRYSHLFDDWAEGQIAGLNPLGSLTYEFYFVKPVQQ